VANAESFDRHHRTYDGSIGQPLLRSGHNRLHLRRHGDAVVRGEVYGRKLQQPGGSSLELQRFPSLFYDRLPCSVWGVDRIDVELYSLRWNSVHSVLPTHDDHRKPRGRQRLLMPAAHAVADASEAEAAAKAAAKAAGLAFFVVYIAPLHMLLIIEQMQRRT